MHLVDATELRLEILKQLLTQPEQAFEAALTPLAPHGHTYPGVDDLLDAPAGRSLDVLEDLADLGLLTRDLTNVVHACPECRWCQLNFRETCPRCEAFDVRVERLLHHFSCGYTGLESEFIQGLDLTCPKCRNKLNQLGQDFDRPHETYVCNPCGCFFEEPLLEAQCLHCSACSPGSEVEATRIYKYRPSPLTVRAIEHGRLTGLDVSQIMYDADVLLVTRDWFVMQTERELLRMRRHGGAFSIVNLTFEDAGRAYPIFREWGVDAIRALGRLLTDSLRPLDLVARLDNARLGLLLVESDAQGTRAVQQRLLSGIEALDVKTRGGRPLTTSWTDHVWNDPKTELETLLLACDLDRRQREEPA